MEPPSLLDRLKRRKLVQWVVGYLAVAWLILQVLDLLRETYEWSPAIQRVAVAVLAAGLCITLVLAWFHGERGHQRVRPLEAILLLAVIAIGAAGVVMVGADERAAAAADADDEAPDHGSIAVLAFADLSPGRDQEYFADGVSEEILNALAQLEGLRVASRTSAFAFKGASVPIDSIAAALRVRHVLEGSVRKWGDSIRVTAQLIDATTGYHLWSRTFDRAAENVFRIQEEIARSVVQELEVAMPGADLVRTTTSDMAAYDLYLRGRYHLNRPSEENLLLARDYFLRAIEMDDRFALAYTGLAFTYVWMADAYLPPSEAYPLAEEAVVRALRIDPELAEAHAVHAAVLAIWHLDTPAAVASLERARRLDPTAGLYQHAALLVSCGRTEDARPLLERLHATDPLSPLVSFAWANYHLVVGKPERALEEARRTQQLAPGFFYRDSQIGVALRELGRYEEALDEYAEVRARLGGRPLAGEAITLALAGRTDRARAELAALERFAATGYVAAEELAAVHAHLGDFYRAIELLREAIAHRSAGVNHLPTSPTFRPLREHPPARAIIARFSCG